jgi:hypothetical protein
VVVLSLWRGGDCVGTFQLEADQVAAFVTALQDRVEVRTPA